MAESPCLLALSQKLFRDVLDKHAVSLSAKQRRRGLFVVAFAAFGQGGGDVRIASRFVPAETIVAETDADVVAILKAVEGLREAVMEKMNPAGEWRLCPTTLTPEALQRSLSLQPTRPQRSTQAAERQRWVAFRLAVSPLSSSQTLIKRCERP